MHRVALIVDDPYRDLPGPVLTVCELARRDVAAFLVPMNIQLTEVWARGAIRCVLCAFVDALAAGLEARRSGVHAGLALCASPGGRGRSREHRQPG